MITLNANELTRFENYRLLIGSIVPRPIAFITTQSENGLVNGAPFSYFNIVSSAPPTVSISIGRRKGKMKDTSRNINENGEFVIHFVDDENVIQINETGAELPSDESEIDYANLTLIDSDFVSVPSIKESKIRFECTLQKHIELGDSETINTDLMIGKIERYHIDPSIYDNGKINLDHFSVVSRLAGADYASIGSIRTIERTK